MMFKVTKLARWETREMKFNDPGAVSIFKIEHTYQQDCLFIRQLRFLILLFSTRTHTRSFVPHFVYCIYIVYFTTTLGLGLNETCNISHWSYVRK